MVRNCSKAIAEQGGDMQTLAFSAVLAVTFTGAAAAQPTVVATVGMIGSVAATVAGDCAAVQVMMGPGSDPHLYQATASDVQRLAGADGVLHMGFGLEGQLGEVLERLGARTPVLAVAPVAVPAADLIEVGGSYGVDPHLWMDAALWSRTVPVIAGFLTELAPGCDGIAARADAHEAELLALHEWVEIAIATIPEDRRALVTAHDAFGYFARAYGIDEVAIQGLSTEAEAAIADIIEVAETVVTRNVPAVFIESTISPRTIEALIAAAGDRGHTVEIGGELYADAMGDAGTAEGTYIGMMHANTVAIVTALGGAVPPLPEALAGWAETWDIAR
jgi:manganese/zinc/iron transport system substrate-binding protein